ncbi:MAG: CbtA family protein [Candidatus Binataceae bacterium]|nr:CbtA family protein [Candidatus Binataceae bacterium]
MLAKTIYPAIAAGILAGVVFFTLQCWTTLPLIHQAERYENAAPAHVASHAGEAPDSKFLRAAFTTAGDVLVAIGFGLLLTAMYAISGRYGLIAGMIWGLAGFATFQLGPALVVSPSIPALELAPLPLRQNAWLIAALLTGIGLAIFAFGPKVAKFGGLLLLFVPIVLFRYLFPLPNEAVPAQAVAALEHNFILLVIGDNLIFWLVLGAISGWMFEIACNPEGPMGAIWTRGDSLT